MSLRIAAVVLSSILLGPLLAAGSTEALDEKNGFRDMTFGTDIGSVSGLTPVEGEGADSVWYVKEGDSMNVGAATLTSLRYNFYKGQFAVAQLAANGNDCDVLAETLREKYGKGSKSSKLVKRSWWIGKQVSMSYEKTADTCEVYILSKAIGDQKDADMKQAGKTPTGGP
jgi:hypothetical protein